MASSKINARSNFRGAKWLRGADYISERKFTEIIIAVREADAAGYESVGVRPASYIGPDSNAVAIVTYGPGGCSIYKSI